MLLVLLFYGGYGVVVYGEVFVAVIGCRVRLGFREMGVSVIFIL